MSVHIIVVSHAFQKNVHKETNFTDRTSKFVTIEKTNLNQKQSLLNQ